MSNIIVRNMQGGAPTSLLDANLFEDTFLRADQPFYTGTQWSTLEDPNSTQGFTAQQLAGIIQVAAVSGLTISNNLGAGFLPIVHLIPRNLSWVQVQGRDQFSQYRVTADNSIGGSLTRIGPSVLDNPNLGATYCALLAVEVPFQISIARHVAGVTTTVVNTAAGAFAIGDTITLTVDQISTGIPRLTLLVNGVQVAQASDNSGSQLLTGLPGIFCLGTSPGRLQTITSFRCGALSRL